MKYIYVIFHCVFLSFLFQSIVDDVYVSTPIIPSFMQHHEIQEKIFLCFCNRMRPIFQYTWVFKFWLLLNPKVATIYHPSITDPYLSKTFKKISYPHPVDDACLSTQIVASLILITIVCVPWLSRSFY